MDGTNGFIFTAGADIPIISVSGEDDCNGDGIVDIIIGENTFNSQTGRSYVVFGDAAPVLINNTLLIYPGGSVPIDSSSLAATDKNHDKDSLVFVPTEVAHGRFERLSQPRAFLLSNFTKKKSAACKFASCTTVVRSRLDIKSLCAPAVLPGLGLKLLRLILSRRLN